MDTILTNTPRPGERPGARLRWSQMPPLIAIYSPCAGSGKSVVATTLMAEFSYEVVKFAGPLKDMARGLLRSMGIKPALVERMVEGDLKEQVIPGFETVTTRKIMQTLGTDWGREAVDSDLWVKVAAGKIKSLRLRGVPVVVDDLRFPNELTTIRELGGMTVRLDRPDPTGDGLSRYEGLLNNELFDRHLMNDGTIEQLRERTRRLVTG